MFNKKTPAQPERARRSVQQPTPRATVFSYHANRAPRSSDSPRDIQQQDKPLRQTPARNWSKIATYVISAVGMLIILVLSLQLQPNVIIKTTGDSSAQIFLRDQEAYTEVANEVLRSALNRNKLTVDTEALAARMTVAFPELETVSVSLPFFGNRPTVYVQPSQPTLVLSTRNNGLYVLDDAGRALIAGNQVPSLDTLRLPVVTDESGLSIETSKIALPRATVAFIKEVSYQLKQKDIMVNSLTLPAGTSELHARFEGVGYHVKFNLYGNAREEAGAFIALKQRLDGQKKVPAEYVDVRVEGRVYYK